MTNEELVALIQAGVDVQENMGQLYQQNRNFIVGIALPYSKSCELDDLMQEAYFGLENAVQSGCIIYLLCWYLDQECNSAILSEQWKPEAGSRSCSGTHFQISAFPG